MSTEGAIGLLLDTFALLGIGIGFVIGQDYDGTLMPFATGFFICTLAALSVVAIVEKGRLFTPHKMVS